MADNFTANPGTGGDTFAADDVGGVKVPYSKIDIGADGVSSPVTVANPMPVDGTVTVSNFPATQPVSGTVDVSNFPAIQAVSAAALPLPSGAATEATLASILAGQVPGQTGMPADTDTYLPFLPVPSFSYRCGFDGAYTNSVDPAFLTLVRTGTGQTVNQTGGSLLITSGTTANAETIVRSVAPFNGNIIWRWQTTLSQRIAQNNFHMELVDLVGSTLAYTINSAVSVTVTFPSVNPFTSNNVGQSMWLGNITGAAGLPNRYAIASVSGLTVTFTVASWPATGSGTLDLFGWNYHSVIYQSTSPTSADFDCQRKGYASGVTAATINTTASGHVGTISVSDGEAAFADQTGASATGIEITRRASRVRNVPLNETELYLQIRCRNGTTNPASGTTWTVGFVDIGNCSTLPVTIQNVSMMSANSGLPCTLESSITQNVSVVSSLPAGANLLGDVQQQYRASATGAASRSHLVSAATTNATVAKASAGRLLGVQFINTTAAIVYLKFHNLATTPTAGAAVFMSIGIPPTGRADFNFEGGIAFTTGIAYTVVTGAPDADATAPLAANAIIGDVIYA